MATKKKKKTQKKDFFLNGPALPPPPLNGPAISGGAFFCGFPYSIEKIFNFHLGLGKSAKSAQNPSTADRSPSSMRTGRAEKKIYDMK